MPDISVISHYYNHPEKVLEQIAHWESLSAAFLSRVEFILVDDCSEQSAAIPPTKLDLKVFRITTDIPWNQPGARNLGAFVARGKWGLFFDMDQIFYPAPMENLLANIACLDDMTLYHFLSESGGYRNHAEGEFRPCHANTFLVNLEKFKIHGMYDEDFAGHYMYDEIYMTEHWEHEGCKRVLLMDGPYFRDMEFSTTGLDRDSTHNKLLGLNKISSGTKNSVGILRFEWQQQYLRSKPEEAIRRPDTTDACG